MTPTIFLDPRRPKARFRPLKALAHFRILIKDKEDTEQVFHIGEALPSKEFLARARRFCESPKGQALMAREPLLAPLMDAHDTLSKLPADSVAHAYMAFMKREGLSAAGLVAESEKMNVGRPRYDDQMQWYGERLRDVHDLVHVLTGYGRDALGEQCALGFSYGQDRGWMPWFLSWAGALEIKRRVKADAPVLAAVRQSHKSGKLAQRLVEQDIMALLAEPLEAARKRMGISEPTAYRQAHAAFRSSGIDPYDFLAAVPA